MRVDSTEEMRALGARLAERLQVGDVVIASGPLGAGKTTLVQGIAVGLGVSDDVTSPTFVIAREHLCRSGQVRLIHVDAYRLRPDGGGALDPAAALFDLDLDTENAIVVMEWGEGLAAVLSPDHVSIGIDVIDENLREVQITGHGDRWQGVAW